MIGILTGFDASRKDGKIAFKVVVPLPGRDVRLGEPCALMIGEEVEKAHAALLIALDAIRATTVRHPSGFCVYCCSTNGEFHSTGCGGMSAIKAVQDSLSFFAATGGTSPTGGAV